METKIGDEVLTVAGFDLRRDDDVEVVRNVNGSPPNQGSTVPLWLKAKARTIRFRRDDLVRTHWRKVWRSMVAD